MRNVKSKKFTLIAAAIILVLSFTIVLAAQGKDITWFSIFEGNSYKLQLENGIKKLEKTDTAILLGTEDLKALLAEKNKAAEVYMDLNTDKYNVDEKGRIMLPISEEKSYDLGKVFFMGSNGWTARNIDIAIDDSKYLSATNAKSYQSVLKDQAPDYHSRLVNQDNTLPDGYNNENLVTIKGVQAIISSKGMKLDKVTLEALKIMLDKAAADGVKGFVLNSTYRSYSEQKNLFDYRFNERKASGAANPYEEASKVVAYPGTSEHQTGMALDILSVEYPKGSVFSQSKEYAWLKENCWDYGFIPRYPEEKTEKTKISFEPWHYRYIGKPLSLYAKQTGLCLEELVESFQKNKLTSFKASDGDVYLFMLIKKGQDFMLEDGLTMDYTLTELTEEDNLIVIKK